MDFCRAQFFFFFFKTTTLIVSDLGLFFLELCTCFVDLEGGGNSIVIGANIGLGVFRPWHLFLVELVHAFWTWHRWEECRYGDMMRARSC